jgi:hypothetical protein
MCFYRSIEKCQAHRLKDGCGVSWAAVYQTAVPDQITQGDITNSVSPGITNDVGGKAVPKKKNGGTEEFLNAAIKAAGRGIVAGPMGAVWEN